MQGNQGFTLIELMVTIAVMGIIAAIAAPSMSNLIIKQQLNKNTRALVSTLMQARAQAAVLHSNVSVHIAPSGSITEDAKNIVWKPESDVIVKRPSGDTTTPDQVIYLSSGGVNIKVGTTTPTLITDSNTIKLCDSKVTKATIITVSLLGSIQQQEGTC